MLAAASFHMPSEATAPSAPPRYATESGQRRLYFAKNKIENLLTTLVTHTVNDDDPNRTQLCEWYLAQIENDTKFVCQQLGQPLIFPLHGQILLIPTESLCSRNVDLLLRPSRKEKWGLPKKSIHFYSPLEHWVSHVPSSASLPMLTSKGMRRPIPLPMKPEQLRLLISSTAVFDANAVAKQKLCSSTRKKLSLPELNYSREIISTVTRQRTKYFKGMKILPDGSRSYVECRL
ncbi:RNase H domain-containing protein [Trichonephila clavipes]|nr:RNase H domain-containing protein [Trichonephila clavipes]